MWKKNTLQSNYIFLYILLKNHILYRFFLLIIESLFVQTSFKNEMNRDRKTKNGYTYTNDFIHFLCIYAFARVLS